MNVQKPRGHTLCTFVTEPEKSSCTLLTQQSYWKYVLEVWPNVNPKNFQQSSAKLMRNRSFGSFFVEWQNILQGQISALAGREKVSHMWSQIIFFILMFIPKAWIRLYSFLVILINNQSTLVNWMQNWIHSLNCLV